jgi:hypothetical protein
MDFLIFGIFGILGIVQYKNNTKNDINTYE